MVNMIAFVAMLFTFTTSCEREPILYLHHEEKGEFEIPIVDLRLEVYWDYELVYGLVYDWRSEWHYGWDTEDMKIFQSDSLGYETPNVFQVRRYHTGMTPHGPHSRPYEDVISGYSYRATYDWGFWDLLLWNDIKTVDGVQSLIFDESTTYEYVTAYTNQTMHQSHYRPSKYTRSFYQPEPLFSAYAVAEEIRQDMKGFVFDSINNVYVKTLEMQLEPVTYIYLTQVILHNNRGKVTGVDGSANLSGMARSVRINDGVAGSDQVTVNYNVRMKNGCTFKDEKVDIIGGRVLTFGMCNINPNRIQKPSRGGTTTRVDDGVRHYIDCNMQFVNGADSTFVFDVTEQVQTRYKGGVITIELDMDTIPPPVVGQKGSGFDAEVEDWQDGGTHEIEMAKRRNIKLNRK